MQGINNPYNFCPCFSPAAPYRYAGPGYYEPLQNNDNQWRVEERKHAVAELAGGPLAPGLTGVVYFMDAPGGTAIYVEVDGLPEFKPAEGDKPPVGPHGFHLHEKGSCEAGDPQNPFQGAGGHWNPTNQPHGNHAGDFPVLFSNHGRAVMYFFTDKFKVTDVIGKAVVIHESPDDYRSQPAGDAGRRLACGVIR